MQQTKNLQLNEPFEKKEFLDRLHKKIEDIDWELAKADVSVFIADKSRLDIWTKRFFHDLMDQLTFV